MIVPIVLDFYTDKEAHYLYEYFSGLVLEEKSVLIASDDYNQAFDYFVSKDRKECDSKYGIYGKNERFITQEIIDDSKEYFINVQEYMDDLGLSRKELDRYLIFKRYRKLEQLLDEVFDYVKSTDRTIDAFFMFRQYKSIDIWAKKKGIKIIYYDLSTYRYPIYETQFYIDINGFLDRTEFYKRFMKFKKQKDKAPILSREEILLLMLRDTKNIKYLKNKPTNEYAVFFQDDLINYKLKALNMTNRELLKYVRQISKGSKIIVRTGPANVADVDGDVEIDNKEYAFETITDCKKIYSRISNISFETLLWGRESHVSEKGLYSNFCNNKMTETELVEFLSFATFALYIPEAKLRNPDYLRWRCNGPSELMIYLDNLSYWLNKKGVDDNFLYLDADIRKDQLMKSTINNISNL